MLLPRVRGWLVEGEGRQSMKTMVRLRLRLRLCWAEIATLQPGDFFLRCILEFLALKKQTIYFVKMQIQKKRSKRATISYGFCSFTY